VEIRDAVKIDATMTIVFVDLERVGQGYTRLCLSGNRRILRNGYAKVAEPGGAITRNSSPASSAALSRP
jgi:hypothetical protein